MPGFNVGDRVAVTVEFWGRDKKGLEGTVVNIQGDYNAQVDFGTAWPDEYSGRCIPRWMDCCYLELARIKPFYLIAIRDGKEVPLKDQPTFETGAQAAEAARNLTLSLGCKVQPRRISIEGDSWKQREKERLENGHYAKMPAAWDLTPIPDHFLHLAREDQTMVSYTESAEKGVLDRQTRTTPGRYLQKFYPLLSQEEAKRYIAMVDNTSVLHFGVTADEIEWVYAKGPNSCMSGHFDPDDADEDEDEDDPKCFDSWCHPVRVYGDSDLQIAYLKAGSRVTARALVWPERKTFVRTYGDEARLKAALEFEGYTKVPSFEGAKIKRIWDTNCRGYVMPYIDGSVQTVKEAGDGKHMVIADDGPVLANTTEGIAYAMQECAKTGQRIDENDGDEGIDVVTCFETWTTQVWCQEAVDDYATQLRARAPGSLFDRWYYFDRDILVQVGDPDNDEYVLPSEASNYERCSFTSWLLPKDDLVELANGSKINRDDFDEQDGFICAGNGKRYLGEDGEEVDGKMYSRTFIDKRAEANARRRERRRLARLEQERQAALAA